nr:TPA_asm: hypothetical protein [Ladona dragonfly adintovirus]
MRGSPTYCRRVYRFRHSFVFHPLHSFPYSYRHSFVFHTPPLHFVTHLFRCSFVSNHPSLFRISFVFQYPHHDVTSSPQLLSGLRPRKTRTYVSPSYSFVLHLSYRYSFVLHHRYSFVLHHRYSYVLHIITHVFCISSLMCLAYRHSFVFYVTHLFSTSLICFLRHRM